MKKWNWILFTLLAGCTAPEDRSAVQLKTAEVMLVHDTSMERIGEIIELKATLKDTLPVLTDSTQRMEVEAAIAALEEAHTLMFDWMHQYKGMYVDTARIDSALRYLDIQLVKIKEVDKAINTSIERGKTIR